MSERVVALMLGVSKAPPFTMEAVLPLARLPVDVEGMAFIIGVSIAVAVLFLVDLRTPVDGGGMAPLAATDGVCKALVLATAAAPFFRVDLMPRFTCEATISATSSMASFKALLSTDEEAKESVVDDDGSLFPARAAASNSS